MGPFRITIARLLVLVAYCGVGFAALRSPSWIWASTLFSAVAAALAAATLAAVYRRGARRAFWTGFALFGWLYLGLSWSPWGGSTMSPLLVTTALMDVAYPTLRPSPSPQGAVRFVPLATGTGVRGATAVLMPGGGGTGTSTQGIWGYWSEPPRNVGPFNWAVPEPYRVICHALLTPLVALPGGLLARRLQRTRDERED